MTRLDTLLEFVAVTLDLTVFISKLTWLGLRGMVISLIPKAEKDLDGEVVLITGSGQGMGREVAIKIAQMGATVVLWDLNESKVKEVAEKIHEEDGKAFWYTCDVSSEAEVNSKAKVVEKEVGEVTILINNAGILQNVPMMQLDSGQIKKTLEINLLAHFWTIRAFLPNMEKNDSGHIVAISSGAGMIGHVNQVDYSASKHGVNGMMEAVSEEYRLKGSNIRFTTICPLTVTTGLNANPSTKYSYLMPVLSVEDAAKEIIGAIRREEILIMIPNRTKVCLSIGRVFSFDTIREFMDFHEYCRVPNSELLIVEPEENEPSES